MEVLYGTIQDIQEWVDLVRKVRDNFPGLETEEAMQDYENTVRKFIGKDQAICAKKEGHIEGDEKGTAPRALYKKYGFCEGELTEEFGYPNQVFVRPVSEQK